uniref:Ankyrin 2b, neuronal n=1 Tax=Sinocyclocheilus rhinocerous TaxID=307959 RepID=A0A673G4C2_9TELE
MNEDTQSHVRMEATDKLNGLGGRRRRPKKVNMGFTLKTCSNGLNALHLAAKEGHVDMVQELLGRGSSVDSATKVKNFFADGKVLIAYMLLSALFEIFVFLFLQDGFTPLAIALQQGHNQVVSILLENDTKGKVRLPALHIAARKDDTKSAALLLQNDHNADVQSKVNMVPHFFGQIKTIDLLYSFLVLFLACRIELFSSSKPLCICHVRNFSFICKLY